MTPDQLRQALGELNGERDAEFSFAGELNSLLVHSAMLVPDEADHLVKVTDGRSIYILDAGRIAWIRIGLSGNRIQK